MRNILLIFALLFFFSSYSFAQNQKKLFELRLLKFEKNGVDYTNWIAERKQSFIFYTNDGEDYLTNYCNSCTDNTQSHGRVYNFTEYDSGAETDKQYAFTHYTFTWRYFNSYDNESGSADMNLFIIHKPNGSTFILKMILSNMDILKYEGYIEETVK
jgi:hypothetical protein